MNPLSKLLFAAALLLGAVGLVVAVVQPGDLGGDSSTETAQLDDGTTTSSSTTAPPSTTTTAPGTSTTTAGDGIDGDGGADEGPVVEGDTTAGGGAGDGSTDGGPTAGGSTAGGSGLVGGDDTPDDLDDGLAATGGTSMVGLALAAAVAGLALRRRGAGTRRAHG